MATNITLVDLRGINGAENKAAAWDIVKKIEVNVGIETKTLETLKLTADAVIL